jgi:hypothetical protein
MSIENWPMYSSTLSTTGVLIVTSAIKGLTPL